MARELAEPTVEVLFEDNHCIVVFKPAGMLVQGDASGQKSLMDFVKEYIKEKHKKPGNVFLGLVHRLDKPVSGVVVFAKTSKGASRLSEQFREHTAKKTYHALVEGVPKPATQTLVHYLRKDERTLKAEVFYEEEPKTQEAELTYFTEKIEGNNALLRIELKTGRFHQIRAQLAAIGHRIVGDVKYGARAPLSDGSIALCASELEFETATSDEIEIISVPLPTNWK